MKKFLSIIFVCALGSTLAFASNPFAGNAKTSDDIKTVSNESSDQEMVNKATEENPLTAVVERLERVVETLENANSTYTKDDGWFCNLAGVSGDPSFVGVGPTEAVAK